MKQAHRITATIFFLSSLSLLTYAQVLYRIQGKQNILPSYLLGVHELIPAKAFDQLPGVYQAFNDCKVVVSEFEINLTQSKEQLLSNALMPSNTTMHSFYNASQYALVDSCLKAGIKSSLGELGRLHPAFTLDLFRNAQMTQAIGILDDVQSDAFFQRVAIEKSIPAIGLSDFGRVPSNAFDSLSLVTYANLLYDECNQKTDRSKSYAALYAHYTQGNVHGFLETLKGLGMHGKAQPLNAEMFRKLEKLITRNACFIVVNMVQLSGENSVVAQLRNAGYEVHAFPKSKKKKK